VISYQWRGDFASAEVEALHADGSGRAPADHDWKAQVQRQPGLGVPAAVPSWLGSSTWPGTAACTRSSSTPWLPGRCGGTESAPGW